MMKTKILAAYLPQYHEIEENNRWWGKGYTDWVAVQKAEPQLKNQIQPRVPLNKNYYCLDKYENIKWQAELAKKYGIYGFAIYHYWFSKDQRLLTTPPELILNHSDIDINFFFVWDNNSWVNKTWKNVSFTNQWAPRFEQSEGDGILAELKYGNENDWKKHYEYLLPFFEDKRYIRENGYPLFGIFQSTNNYNLLQRMCKYFNDLAIKDGFPGIRFISAATFSRTKLDIAFRYEPFNVCSPKDYLNRRIMKNRELKVYDYDKIWQKILFNAKCFREKNTILGGFVRYDDTPRRGNTANIVIGDTPDKFRKYMERLIRISRQQHKEYIYLTAWNEWGEGAYLEPDEESGYAYLEALKDAVESNEY